MHFTSLSGWRSSVPVASIIPLGDEFIEVDELGEVNKSVLDELELDEHEKLDELDDSNVKFCSS